MGTKTENSEIFSESQYTQTLEEASSAFKKLFATIIRLRSPGGCPWDIKQTPLTMRSDLIEECFEAADAIRAQDEPHVKEELGDVFLNTAMISFMYEQQGNFSLAGVLTDINEKIIRRHPHVFPESEGKVHENGKKAQTAEEVLTQWDAIKRGIEGRAGESVLDEVSSGLPPLMKAYKMQKKAAKKGFDWDNPEPVKAKVFEELEELEAAVKQGVKDEVEEEAGDVFFALVNYVRHLGVDPEIALERANKKFRKRFGYVEQKMSEHGLTKDNADLEMLDRFWNEVKAMDE